MAWWWNLMARLTWDLEKCGMEVPLSDSMSRIWSRLPTKIQSVKHQLWFGKKFRTICRLDYLHQLHFSGITSLELQPFLLIFGTGSRCVQCNFTHVVITGKCIPHYRLNKNWVLQCDFHYIQVRNSIGHLALPYDVFCSLN